MDIKLAIAFITSLMAIGLALLNFRLTREGNRESRNAELRTQSYIDFISVVSELASSKEYFNNRPQSLTNRLIDAKTRIAIYGAPEVVSQLAKFDKDYGVINSEESRDSFLLVVRKMREAATGRSASDLNDEINQVLFGVSNGL